MGCLTEMSLLKAVRSWVVCKKFEKENEGLYLVWNTIL